MLKSEAVGNLPGRCGNANGLQILLHLFGNGQLTGMNTVVAQHTGDDIANQLYLAVHAGLSFD